MATSEPDMIERQARLGDIKVGSEVLLNVGGTATRFIVIHQGLPGSMYDSSCDGTWLLMYGIYENRAWDTTNSDYEQSDIHAYLNGAFLNLFDADIAAAIKSAKIPYVRGDGLNGSVASGSNGLDAKVFLLSSCEQGFTTSDYSGLPADGSVLSYFNGIANSNRIAKYNSTATEYWHRTPKTNLYYVQTTTTSGKLFVSFGRSCTNSYGVRPALIMPADLETDENGYVIAKAPIAHKTLVSATSRTVSSGSALVGATGYALSKGRTYVSAVGYDVPLDAPVKTYTLTITNATVNTAETNSLACGDISVNLFEHSETLTYSVLAGDVVNITVCSPNSPVRTMYLYVDDVLVGRGTDTGMYSHDITVESDIDVACSISGNNWYVRVTT